jgi:hypothetical protein
MSDMPSGGIKFEQCLFGYSDGHRLLAASSGVTDKITSALLPYSDLTAGVVDRSQPYWTGLPVPGAKKYALMRTWPAPEMPRPGCVWTHVILIDFPDMAKFENLAQLMANVRRPQSNEDFGPYQRSIQVSSFIDVPSALPFTIREAVQLLRCIYGPVQRSLRGVSTSPDGLIFAVWSQQWPRLRRSFAFQTAILAQADTSSRFDLRISATVMNEPLEEPIKRSEAEAAMDVSDGSLSDFRRFLWRYGSDLKNGRGRFWILTELYCDLVREETPERFGSAIERVYAHFPDIDDALTLKNDLLGFSNSEWSAFGNPDPIAVIRFLVERPDLVSGMLMAEKHLPPIREVLETRSSELMALAEEAAKRRTAFSELLFDEIADYATPISFLKLSAQFSSVRREVITRRPELLDDDDVAQVPPEDLVALINVSRVDHDLLLRLAPRLLSADSKLLADFFFNAVPSEVAVLVIDRTMNGTPLPRCWTELLARIDATEIADIVLNRANSTSELATGISLFRWNVRIGASMSVERWSGLVRRLKDTVEGTDAQWLRCFLLAISLDNPQKGREPLVEYAFEAVHDDIAHSRLPYGAFELISPYLAGVAFWLIWDTCLRLRISIVKAYVLSNLSRQSFVRLADNKKLRGLMLELMSESKAGRRFLKD